jgi:hypothetical protein
MRKLVMKYHFMGRTVSEIAYICKVQATSVEEVLFEYKQGWISEDGTWIVKTK